MSVVPRSLCAIDGTLFVPTDKSSLMNKVNGVTGPSAQPELPVIIYQHGWVDPTYQPNMGSDTP